MYNCIIIKTQFLLPDLPSVTSHITAPQLFKFRLFIHILLETLYFPALKVETRAHLVTLRSSQVRT